MNNQHNMKASPLLRYNSARSNLLMVIIFTFLNIVLTTANSGFYMLFSASIPYFIASEGVYLYSEGYSLQLMLSLVIIGIALLVPYLVFWIFSKKHRGWMIAALVYFSLDLIFLLYFFNISMLLDILFHAWVLYFLIIGVATGKKAFEEMASGEAPANTNGTAGTENSYSEDEYGYITSRSITVERTGSFTGGAIPYTCVFIQDGREKHFQVDKGKSIIIPASSSRFQIKIFAPSSQSESFIGGEGTENKHYVVDSKYSLFKGTSFVISEA